MELENFELTCHGIDYLVSLKSKNEDLNLIVEEKATGQIWKGEFAGKYVEEITQKTGNFRKFDVFVKMLVSGIKQETEAISLDIMTYQDLEFLRNKKDNSTSSSKSNISSNKRYMILTSANEFDRIHYPLPLNLEENPQPELLKQTISRLSSEIQSVRMRATATENMSESARSSFYS